MIASYLLNFIFIKTRKTAGTTIEMLLAPLCGPKDIVTPIGNRDEILRGNGQPLCRNFASDPAIEEFVRETILLRKTAKLEARKNAVRFEFFNHMDAVRIKAKMAPEFWKKAFKFTAERHPYEKAVSLAYFWHGSRNANVPFGQHLDSIVRTGSYPSYGFYTIDDRVIVDDFVRYESLHDDLKRIGTRLGIPIPGRLPRAKTNTRKDKRPAREILSDAQKEIVYSRCRKEFELLGYEA